mgnify:CR=1 FL=1
MREQRGDEGSGRVAGREVREERKERLGVGADDPDLINVNVKKITRKNMILTNNVNRLALFFDDKLFFKTYFFGLVAILTFASNNVAIPATSTSFSTGTLLSQCKTIKPSFP